MANGIRGDITLERALNALSDYDPCDLNFETYTEMDQTVPAYEVWKEADLDDLGWVIAVLGLRKDLQAYQTFKEKEKEADELRAAAHDRSYDEWDKAREAAYAMTDAEARSDALRMVTVARHTAYDAAWEACNKAHIAAHRDYEKALRSRKTYRLVLEMVKSLMG